MMILPLVLALAAFSSAADIRMAYTNYGHLILADENGAPIRTVQADPRGFSNLAWSADGRHLIFYGHADPLTQQSEKEILVADAAGGAIRTLKKALGGSFPVWSADGKWIYFTRLSPESAVMAIKPDGTGLRQVCGKIPQGHLTAINPSPDGRRLAGTISQKIWVMDADCSNPVELISDSKYKLLMGWGAAGIAYSHMMNSDPALVVIDPDGGNLRTCTSRYGGYTWAEGGSLLVIRTEWNDEGNAKMGHIVRLDPAACTETILSSHPDSLFGHPAWRPRTKAAKAKPAATKKN